jgi:hypothetical protein
MVQSLSQCFFLHVEVEYILAGRGPIIAIFFLFLSNYVVQYTPSSAT